jgi:vacuolar protein sorting-associated protein 33A
MRGDKGLVLEPSLSGPLGLMVEVKTLKVRSTPAHIVQRSRTLQIPRTDIHHVHHRAVQEHGVEKMYHLGPQPVSTEVKNLIYLVRPTLMNARYIAKHIQVCPLRPRSCAVGLTPATDLRAVCTIWSQ